MAEHSLIAQARRVLAALAGVGLAADAVHGDGQALVGLLGDGAVAHGAGFESLDNGRHRLHLVDGDAAALIELEVQQPPQGMGLGRLVHQGGILLEGLVAARPGRPSAAAGWSGGCTCGPPCPRPDRSLWMPVESSVESYAQAQGIEGLAVVATPRPPRSPARPIPSTRLTVLVKYLSTTSRLMPTALEDLGGLVGLDGGDAHFGGDLHDAVEDGADCSR